MYESGSFIWGMLDMWSIIFILSWFAEVDVFLHFGGTCFFRVIIESTPGIALATRAFLMLLCQ